MPCCYVHLQSSDMKYMSKKWQNGIDLAENNVTFAILLTFKTTTMADIIEKIVDSGKTFFDISGNTDQINRGFEADTPKNDSNIPIVCNFWTDIWLKRY